MPSPRRDRFPELLSSLIALLIAALLVPSALATASAASARHTSVSAARSLGKANRCTKRIPPARLKQMNAQRRKRIARRLRSCRRRLATKSTAPASSLYWGAWIGDQLTGTEAPWDMGAVSKFEQSVGKQLSLVHFAAPFADCSVSPCSFYKFPTKSMEDVRSHGAIPFFSWSSQSTPSNINEPDFQLSDVIAGTYDSYIRGFAEAAKAWGHPFFLRFNWEMNGNWFSWSEGVNGNQQGEYVAAWRHVHDIFTSVGATNVSWVWCPNIDPGKEFSDIAPLYPGDSYVDWTSLDGYNWGANPVRPARWMSFDQLFNSTYHRIVDTIAPSRPMVIGEVGSSEYGGSKANWISEMLRDLPTEYPAIHGLLWFDKFVPGEDMDWQLDSSASATSAFAAGIQSPSYKGNEFSALSGGAVSPPA